ADTRVEEAVCSARALVEQLAPTMAAIANVMYHRDVNAHNILAHVAPGGQLSFGLVDFGLAVDASTWMDPSPLNPGGKSEWEFLDVGGDCRYWPVSAWRQFEAGCRALVEEEPLCTEYQTHLDLQGLGLTAVQVLVCLLPKRHAELVRSAGCSARREGTRAAAASGGLAEILGGGLLLLGRLAGDLPPWGRLGGAEAGVCGPRGAQDHCEQAGGIARDPGPVLVRCGGCQPRGR
ncbi:unnamed protein product, partial [Effrenium voratum]